MWTPAERLGARNNIARAYASAKTQPAVPAWAGTGGLEPFDHAFQRVFFRGQFHQPDFHHIPDGNQPDHLVALDHRNMTEPPVGHLLQHRIRRIAAHAGDHARGHDAIDGFRRAARATAAQLAHDVTLGDDPAKTLAVNG